MEKTTKIKIGVAVVYSAALVAVGRYTTPEKVKIETKTVTVEKVVYKDKEDDKEKKHEHTVVKEDKKPDGEVLTTTDTTYDDNKEDKKTDDTITNTSTTQDNIKEVTRGSAPVTISALGGVYINGITPVYGLSVTKPILGPLTVGIWGITSTNPSVVGPSCGLSVGLTF